MQPRFTELSKLRVTSKEFGSFEGYVIAWLLRDGRWIYKVSISEQPHKGDSFDNWIPEESLELVQ